MNQKVARELMGGNFAGFEEINHLQFNIPQAEQTALEDIPFSEAVLKERRTTHVLFIGLPLTISEIVHRWPKAFYCEDHPFACRLASKRAECRWYLMSKDVSLSTVGATWMEQQKLLGGNEEAPLASEVATAAVLFRLTRRVFLFVSAFTRCRDRTDRNTERLVLGYQGDNGVYVRVCRDSYRGNLIGLAASCRI